ASAVGLTWQVFPVAAASDYDEIFARLAAEHFDAAHVSATPFNVNNHTRICQLALRHRIPTVGETSRWAKGTIPSPLPAHGRNACGLLLSYGQDVSWSNARAIDYVDKILRGANPSDLPVEQAAKIDLVINPLSPTRASCSRLGRLASSSARVGIATILQWSL